MNKEEFVRPICATCEHKVEIDEFENDFLCGISFYIDYVTGKKIHKTCSVLRKPAFSFDSCPIVKAEQKRIKEEEMNELKRRHGKETN